MKPWRPSWPTDWPSWRVEPPSANAVHEIFLLNDLDSDGCITREEWLGSDAVFDTLDTDKDGRLAPEDGRGGLGAALAISRSEPA